MRAKRSVVSAAVGVLLVFGAQTAASAAPVAWTDWTAATTGVPGSASGTISTTFQGSISVTYAGEVAGPIGTGQVPTNLGAPGTNYWGSGAPYTSAVVDNAPTGSDRIGLLGQSVNPITNTITFSQAVINPVMAILSLGTGSNHVTYDFDSPFDILSTGPGAFGGGTTNLFEESGDRLKGVEGHGTIQFIGTFTSISWTASPTESWHAFQFGVLDVAATPAPAPGALALVGLGLVLSGLFGFGIRRRRRPRPLTSR